MKAKSGTLACGIDIGVGRESQQDALVVSTQHDGYAVIDGMGGMGRGDEAAQVLAESLLQGFEKQTPFIQVQRQASETMREKGIFQGGACYVAFRLTGKELSVAWAGDVELFLAEEGEKIIFSTEKEGFGAWVFNSVQGKSEGKTNLASLEVKSGQRIYAATDGLWANIEPSIAIQETARLSPAEAVKHLAQRAKHKMIAEEKNSARDNLTILVYDIAFEE